MTKATELKHDKLDTNELENLTQELEKNTKTIVEIVNNLASGNISYNTAIVMINALLDRNGKLQEEIRGLVSQGQEVAQEKQEKQEKQKGPTAAAAQPVQVRVVESSTSDRDSSSMEYRSSEMVERWRRMDNNRGRILYIVRLTEGKLLLQGVGGGLQEVFAQSQARFEELLENHSFQGLLRNPTILDVERVLNATIKVLEEIVEATKGILEEAKVVDEDKKQKAQSLITDAENRIKILEQIKEAITGERLHLIGEALNALNKVIVPSEVVHYTTVEDQVQQKEGGATQVRSNKDLLVALEQRAGATEGRTRGMFKVDYLAVNEEGVWYLVYVPEGSQGQAQAKTQPLAEAELPEDKTRSIGIVRLPFTLELSCSNEATEELARRLGSQKLQVSTAEGKIEVTISSALNLAELLKARKALAEEQMRLQKTRKGKPSASAKP